MYLVYNGISNIINCGNNNDNNSNVVIDNIDGIWLNVWSARQWKRLQVSSTARKAADETFMIVISNLLETIKRVSSQWCSWFTLARFLSRNKIRICAELFRPKIPRRRQWFFSLKSSCQKLSAYVYPWRRYETKTTKKQQQIVACHIWVVGQEGQRLFGAMVTSDSLIS